MKLIATVEPRTSIDVRSESFQLRSQSGHTVFTVKIERAVTDDYRALGNAWAVASQLMGLINLHNVESELPPPGF